MKWQRSLPSRLSLVFYGLVFTACSMQLPTQHPRFTRLPLPKLAPSFRNGMTRLRSRPHLLLIADIGSLDLTFTL